MNTVMGFMICFCLLCVAYKLGLTVDLDDNRDSNSGSNKSNQPIKRPTKTMYYARGMWHTSGMLHYTYSDALDECRELQTKYPTDMFTVESKEVDAD